jgi:PilZ domain
MPRLRLLARLRPGKRKKPERRAAVRCAPAQEIVCYWSRGGEFVRARVYDISSGGARLLVRTPPEVGTELAVELINGPNTFLCARRLRVVRIYRATGNQSIIGGQFDQKLGYDELLPFVV